MQLNDHYLIANCSPFVLRTIVNWNSPLLPIMALRKAIEDIVAWRKLGRESRALFQGFLPSGGRSYLCVLKKPINTPAGQFSAIKLKAVGNTEPKDPHPPKLDKSFINNLFKIIVEENGSIAVGPIHSQPLYGRTMDRVTAENEFLRLVNKKKLPAPYALGGGEYPDLMFQGQPLGFNILALKEWGADNRRLGNCFFIDHQAANDDQLGYSFEQAGKVQRRYNDEGLIPSDCHVFNFAITDNGEVILNDFGSGKNKDDLTHPQTAIYQLLDLARFIFSVYLLRGEPAGDRFLVHARPLSAFLKGYFGSDVFLRYKKEIGAPEAMLKRLQKPRIRSGGEDKENFRRILWYCCTQLSIPLQEILVAEGNTYLLTKKQWAEKYDELVRGLSKII